MSRKRVLAALVVGLVGVIAAVALSKGEVRNLDADWPSNVAHRGASSRAPENTLEAFRLAAESGAGGLELDVHMTSDGGVVVIHDDTVDRTTDGVGPVRGMSLREVRGLDAGYRFAATEGEGAYPYRGGGVRVPELGEVLRGFPDLKVNIEVKEDQPGVEEALLEIIRDADAEDRVLVVSELQVVLERFRELSGGAVATGASRREIEDFYYMSRQGLEGSLNLPYDALQVPVEFAGRELVTPRFVEAAHDRGVRVDVWTINDAQEMRRLLDLGVDSIMTDRPEILSEVLAERR